MTVARELGKYTLGLVGVQEVKWGHCKSRGSNVFYGKEMKINWEQNSSYTT